MITLNPRRLAARRAHRPCSPFLFAILAALGIAPCLAHADVFNEIGDAGHHPAPPQNTGGGAALTEIFGSLTGEAEDPFDFVDMFVIRVTSSALFTATTSGSGLDDSQLFLFTPSGLGVTHNDDDPEADSVFQSTIGAGGPGPGTLVPPGVYILAVSGYNFEPVSAAVQRLWADEPFEDETAPDGPGALSTAAAWEDFSAPFSPESGDYVITLTGAETATIPAPSSIGLLGLALFASGCRRRSGTVARRAVN